ncbi:extracellular solute-binding protein [Paenibacillus peoriae]|uniref:ABC transporter substrate-binding protein n=1 Tax=Paenibacillus peoriae TaxID=59893 RepID=UPI00026C5B6B|nr:extracellular solute-binding protein [Paenibacillus peoriae]MEC0183184.1 extracellular solute-binding protein [Paenibacillus peoriae]
MKHSLKKALTGGLALTLLASVLTACGNVGNEANAINEPVKELTLAEMETKAKEEGSIASVGMPDSWANWKETWEELEAKYNITHSDTDMSSGEEIAKFKAEQKSPTADIGDVGISFGPQAVAQGVTQPYKTSYWDEIPSWAKDDEGHWIVGYQGTLAFFTNKSKVANPPKSWEDLRNGDYKVIVGDVMTGAQSQMAVLAAAIAFGGDETNLEPGIAFFEELAKKGRLSSTEASVANIEKGEVEVALLWDFNALNYRDQVDKEKYDVAIPAEGSVVSGYATIINKYAPHPNAAKLAREYILSDEGQINLAKGYARPIREGVKLPQEVADILLPNEEYKNAKPITDYNAWEKTVETLPQQWQERVLVYMN